jgi:hypothetical protein
MSEPPERRWCPHCGTDHLVTCGDRTVAALERRIAQLEAQIRSARLDRRR